MMEIDAVKSLADQIRDEVGKAVIGQSDTVDLMLIALFSGGHILLEGPPGTAKTLLTQCFSAAIKLEFGRIQFTPDLMPGDVLGTNLFNFSTSEFTLTKGPIFTDILLADEINRTPPKTQAALLEAMQERKVTIDGDTHELNDRFTVIATQNPIEQQGTYPLPEAQLDRFLMHLNIDYPGVETELQVLKLNRNEALENKVEKPDELSQQDIFAARKDVLNIHLAPQLEEYLVQLIIATRQPEKYDAQLASWIGFGASPRATIALDRCSRAKAWLAGRDFVTPDDIQAVFHNVLRHRLILTYEAEADGITTDQVLDQLLKLVPVP